MFKENFPKDLLNYLDNGELLELIALNVKINIKNIPKDLEKHLNSEMINDIEKHMIFEEKLIKLFDIIESKIPSYRDKETIDSRSSLSMYKKLEWIYERLIDKFDPKDHEEIRLIMDINLYNTLIKNGMMGQKSFFDPMINPFAGYFGPFKVYVNVYSANTNELIVCDGSDYNTIRKFEIKGIEDKNESE